MKFIDEFKEFIARGSVIDMAVGVVVGGAFKSIVDSLVADIINPFIAFITSFGAQDDVANLSKWVIPHTGINIGNFISSIINFLIMAFIIFCLVKSMNKIREKFSPKKEEDAIPEEVPASPTQEELLIEIRDLLKASAQATEYENKE